TSRREARTMNSNRLPAVNEDQLIAEAVEFAASKPPEKEDELRRHFWPEILGGTGADPASLEARVSAARKKRATSHNGQTQQPPQRDEEGRAPGGLLGGTAAPANSFPYSVRDGQICRTKYTRDGEEFLEPLCNFDCRIIEETAHDDGSGEMKHYLTLQG